jgi:hypothetical protein
MNTLARYFDTAWLKKEGSPMTNRRALSSLGSRVYGLGGIAFGLVGLVWSIFATPWWPLQALPFSLPHREALGYVVAVCLVLSGAAIQWRRTAQAGVVVLAILHFMSALLWLPRVVRFPRIYGTWAGFLEQFSLVAAGLVTYAFLTPRNTLWTVRTAQIGRFLYGICVISYGLAHFFPLSFTASMVPKWIPPGQQFWAVVASRLLTTMLIGFSALVWAPLLFAHPRVHTAWAGNAINLAFIGAAWVVADSIASRQKKVQDQQDPRPKPA